MAAKPIRATVAVDTKGLGAVAKITQQKTITLKAVRAGAKIVAKAAKARAPRRKRSGALKLSIGTKAAKGKRGRTTAYAVIGARKKVSKVVPVGRGGRMVKAVPAYYAHLVEGGTRPHRLKRGARLARRTQAARGQGAGGQHPGAKAKPFLGPAFDATKDRAMAEAQRVLGEETRKLIAKQAARLAAKRGR